MIISGSDKHLRMVDVAQRRLEAKSGKPQVCHSHHAWDFSLWLLCCICHDLCLLGCDTLSLGMYFTGI